MATRPPVSMPKLTKRSRFLLILGGAVILAMLLGSRLLSAYVDWLWFGEVGARSVYATVLFTRIVLFFAVGIVVGGLVAVSLVIAYRTRPVFVPVSSEDDPLARYRSTVVARVRLFGIGIPVFVGFIAGATAQGDWELVQLFFNGTQFGQVDPEFGKDIGFYVFNLPFYNWLLGWVFVVVAVSFIAAAAAHYLFGGIRLAGRGGQFTNPARVQLAVTAGIFVLLKAVEYFLDRYNLLFSDRNNLFTGATYTDLNAVLPAKLILIFIAVFCAIAFFAGAVLRNLQLPAIALVLLILSSILVGAAWPAILEQFSVKPNAIEKEAESIQRNMDATKNAYDLNDVEYIDYDPQATASEEELQSSRGTISNIRLLDPSVLEPTFTQRVGRQNFYGFPEKLDVDRYTINGEMQDYIVAAKEIKTEGLAANQRNWINQHLVYTHGNGFVAAPANTINRAVGDADASDAGYPIAKTSDTTNPDGSGIQVDQPRIYYGELSTSYAIVGGPEGVAPGEYDSASETNYRYTGQGGVPIDGWINRLVFAAQNSERNILFSNAIGEGSRIMYIRDPRDRVKKKAPWLTVDGDPYPAVIDGRIKWIVDGYTTTNSFPYAQKTQLGEVTQDTLTGVARLANKPISYIRNSVKATVDAYDGTITLYALDDKEPILNAWMKVFPGLVEPSSEISDELRAHFRYPEDMFKVQRDLLTQYHVGSPQEFFSTNTFWSVPADPTEGGDSSGNQPPYYLLAQLPGERQSTFQLTSSLTPLRRQYLAAWMSASSDPENYGEMTVLRLPTDDPSKQTDGPVQVQNRFQSDPRVAQERTLFNNPSIRVIYGNQLTLPVAGGFLYVEPLYIQQTNENSYPQLARVLVQFGGRVGFAPTLQGALDQVLGQQAAELATAPEEEAGTPPEEQGDPEGPATPRPEPAGSGEAAAAAEDMQQAWAKYKAAQAEGDYAGQGEALAELDAAARRYDQTSQSDGG
ncbi:MAG: UPF0182 family protein [Pseudonocardiaceae bacterium]